MLQLPSLTLPRVRVGLWGPPSLRPFSRGLPPQMFAQVFIHVRERVSDVPCLLLILKTLIAFQKMFPQNCKKVESTNKEHRKTGSKTES